MTAADPPPATPIPALPEHARDQRTERVLVASDGGEAGSAALRWVATRASTHRLVVTVLTVVEQDWISGEFTGDRFEDAADQVVRRARDYLATAAASTTVTTRVERGDPRALFSRASANHDLLVVGTNRTGKLSAMLGSTFPIKLVEGAKCPVVVVPRNWVSGRGAVVAGIQGDGSDDAAVRFALHEARVLHRELRVVHAWGVPTILGPELPFADDDAGVADSHDVILSRAVDELRIAAPDVVIRGVLAEGEPAEVLAREAEHEELLVVGSHGWTVMDRFFLGSISREILTRPPCPVAVVRPHEKG
ncbi:universal stress protein [Naasia sp. SYSU D00948]|uniref:universal stress protein n=1 Tax=Naasia sp. SYSU D00948 TaxID=2817379 RepID=UPI001B31429E|nr:universal stress protein [Naasia sp. SYSU D00948]